MSLRNSSAEVTRLWPRHFFLGRAKGHLALAFSWRGRRYIIGRDSGHWMAWSIADVYTRGYSQ